MNVLVLGGSGFMGSETVARLLAASHRVTILCRGRWSWDSEVSSLQQKNFDRC